MACLQQSDPNAVVGDGCHNLAELLAKPSLLGYEPSPYKLSDTAKQALQRFGSFEEVFPICTRSTSKALFGLVRNAGDILVLKTYTIDKKAGATRELKALTLLAEIPGIPNLEHHRCISLEDQDTPKVPRASFLCSRQRCSPSPH
jgi:hypothetical protein